MIATGLGEAAVAADETGPIVVLEAPDHAEVRVAAGFPAGWRAEATVEGATRREINDLWADERCELATRTSEFSDPVVDVDDFVVGLGPGSGFSLLGRATVELPAGSAERIEFADDGGGAWAVYILPDGPRMHELWCRADELPEGRWLSIAETMELGPETSLVDSGFDGRVVLPEHGVALTFPEAWQVRGSSTRLGALYAASDTAICTVSDYTSLAADADWGSLDDFHTSYVANAEENAAIRVTEVSYVETPAGPAGLADLAWDDGTRAIRYSLANEGRWLSFFCVGDPVPDDRWQSLVASLEWLPQG